MSNCKCMTPRPTRIHHDRITELEAELFDCLERIVELTTRVQAQATIIRDQGGWLAEAKAENTKLRAALVIADNYLARSDRHIPYNVAVAVKGALK
jgi:hypothetical protein